MRKLLGLALMLGCVNLAAADEFNPAAKEGGNGLGTSGPISQPQALTAFTDRNAWAAAAGATTLIDFEGFASGTVLNGQLASKGIASWSGTSQFGAPQQIITASSALPFPMFTAGTLPSEPNFVSNTLSGPIFATGTITVKLVSPAKAIGAFVADGSPLGNFEIEVFSGGSSLGFISVSPRTLPDSFVGVVSDAAFDSATFRAASGTDSWGLDNMEHNANSCTGNEKIKKVKCKKGKLKVKTIGTNAGDDVKGTTGGTCGTQTKTVQAKANGSATIKFTGCGSGTGSVRVEWECGANSSATYNCP